MGRKKSGCFVFGGEEPRAVIAGAPEHTPAPHTATPALRGNLRQSETRERRAARCGRVDPLRARLAGTSSQVRFPSLRRLRGGPAHCASLKKL